MKFYIFIVLLSIFAVYDAASRRRKNRTSTTISTTPTTTSTATQPSSRKQHTTSTISTTLTTASTSTHPSNQSPSCMDYSTVMCEVAFKISNNRKKFCYERGHHCCETCNGTYTATSSTTTATTTTTTTEAYMVDTTTESNDESATCTDISSVVCQTGYDQAMDKISFCIDTGYLCCETCDEK